MTDDTTIFCPHCEAKQLGPSETCWLCHQPLADEPTTAMPPPTVLQSREPEGMTFSLATMFLIVTLVSVGMGLLVALPGLGVLACIVMVPVLVRTMRVVRHREARGQDVRPAEKVLLFVTSYSVASVLMIVVCVSAFCSFCGVCLTLFSLGSSSRGDTLAWGLGMCAVAAVGLMLMIKMIGWIRRRYRRDIGEE